MEALKENKGLVAVAILLALVIGASVYNSNRSDSESKAEATQSEETKDEKAKSDDKDDTKTADSDSESAATSEATYDYVAQPGDSYSVLARKAVQTYGIINDVKLSHAEILAAEAKLTTDAGNQYLNEGQAVSFNVADVKSAMDYSQELSDADKAAWATYVPYVDFDTRQHGE